MARRQPSTTPPPNQRQDARPSDADILAIAAEAERHHAERRERQRQAAREREAEQRRRHAAVLAARAAEAAAARAREAAALRKAADEEWERAARARQNQSTAVPHPARRAALLTSAAPDHPPAFVYVITAANGLVKVGVTQNPTKRLAQLQTATHHRLEIYATEPIDGQDPYAAERDAHRLLQRHRVRGEWFDCHPEAALAAIRKAAFWADNGAE